MKYAFNTWVYGSFPVWVPSYTLDETIKRIAAAGYDGIEIGCAAPHAWPAHLSAERRKDIKALLEGENLTPVSLLPAPGGGPGSHRPNVSAGRGEPSSVTAVTSSPVSALACLAGSAAVAEASTNVGSAP